MHAGGFQLATLWPYSDCTSNQPAEPSNPAAIHKFPQEKPRLTVKFQFSSFSFVLKKKIKQKEAGAVFGEPFRQETGRRRRSGS